MGGVTLQNLALLTVKFSVILSAEFVTPMPTIYILHSELDKKRFVNRLEKDLHTRAFDVITEDLQIFEGDKVRTQHKVGEKTKVISDVCAIISSNNVDSDWVQENLVKWVESSSEIQDEDDFRDFSIEPSLNARSHLFIYVIDDVVLPSSLEKFATHLNAKEIGVAAEALDKRLFGETTQNLQQNISRKPADLSVTFQSIDNIPRLKMNEEESDAYATIAYARERGMYHVILCVSFGYALTKSYNEWIFESWLKEALSQSLNASLVSLAISDLSRSNSFFEMNTSGESRDNTFRFTSGGLLCMFQQHRPDFSQFMKRVGLRIVTLFFQPPYFVEEEKLIKSVGDFPLLISAIVDELATRNLVQVRTRGDGSRVISAVSDALEFQASHDFL